MLTLLALPPKATLAAFPPILSHGKRIYFYIYVYTLYTSNELHTDVIFTCVALSTPPLRPWDPPHL